MCRVAGPSVPSVPCGAVGARCQIRISAPGLGEADRLSRASASFSNGAQL